MANFTAGTSFSDGVTNDVTAAKLNALVADAVPTSNLSLTSTTGTIATFNSTTGTIPTLVATTLITTGTGTAAAPAIVPTGDTNTGIFFPAADTIAFSEGGAEAMRINSSGNVGIGSTGPQAVLDLGNASAGRGITWAGAAGADRYNSIFSSYSAAALVLSSGFHGSTSADSYISSYTGTQGLAGIRFDSFGGDAGTIRFFTDATASRTAGGAVVPTERLRIDSSGNVLVGATSAQSSERLLAQNDSATNPSFIAYSPSATFTGYVARLFADRNTSNSTYNFLSCTRVATAGDVFIIRDSGNAVNTNNSYGAISDIKLKENIENASSQWNDIKSLQVRKFSFKNDEEHKRMLGLVAQEVELISPNLVETVIDRDKDGSDLGTTTKEVKYSVLYMKAVKALQEAMGRIETLEAKVTALEAA